MRISEITDYLESIAPLAFQESYDNAGLLAGDPESEVDCALIALDITEAVVDEAATKGIKLIISHHPLIFNNIKNISSRTETGRCLIKAIRHDIAIYAAHTNLDNIAGGVNSKICEKLGLTNCNILAPMNGILKKLVTFIPSEHADRVQKAVFAAGAGHIGNYDHCGYSLEGKGSFRADEHSNPFVGNKGDIHYEREIRFETVFPAYRSNNVIRALLDSHPYEEVAYDIYTLDNRYALAGWGMAGETSEAVGEREFLLTLKNLFGTTVIKHSPLLNKKIKKVAVCGGAGSFLINTAVKANADVFVTGEIKYHQYFEAAGKIVLVELGHFESEQFTNELFRELLTEKFPNFAIYLSEVKTNPVNYLV